MRIFHYFVADKLREVNKSENTMYTKHHMYMPPILLPTSTPSLPPGERPPRPRPRPLSSSTCAPSTAEEGNEHVLE